MNFINLLNETAVVWVASIGAYEAYSPFGEVREFATYSEGNAWRIAEIRAAL